MTDYASGSAPARALVRILLGAALLIALLGGIMTASASPALPGSPLRVQQSEPTASQPTHANPIGDDYFMIYAVLYDLGGQGVAYYDTGPGNQEGAYRQDDVDIKQRGAGRYHVGWMETGEWLNYTIDVPQTGRYDLTVRAATIEPEATLSVRVDGEEMVTLLIPPTGSYDIFAETPVSGGWIEAGTRVIQLYVQQQYFDLEWVRFDLVEPASPPVFFGPRIPPSTPDPQFPNEVGPDYVLIQAEHYDEGGQGIAYFDTTPGNWGGAYRQDDVDIKSIGEGEYALGWMAQHEWLQYTVEVPRTGVYEVAVRASTIEPGATLRIEVDRRPLASIPIPNTGSYDMFQAFTVPGGPIESGQHTIRLVVEQEYFDLDWVRLTLIDGAAAPLATTPTPVPTEAVVATPALEASEGYGPRARTFTCPPGAVRMAPGADLQAVVDANPPGTTYCLGAGIHQNQTIRPKSNDTYIGEPGAVMDGGLATRYAFRSIFEPNASAPTVNVTIQGLTIQRYASASSVREQISPEGAIEGQEGWLIEGNLIRDNISGISLGRANWGWGDGAIIRDNRILENAEIGVEINGSNILFEHNELAGNGWALTDRDRAWSGGGSKFTDQRVWVDTQFSESISRERTPEDNLVIRRNHVHSNIGIGLWLDVNNRYAIIAENLVESNYGSGILDELSANTTIRNNVIRNNRAGNTVRGVWGGAEILVVNSQGGDVYENEVTVSGTGRAVVMIYESYRSHYPGRDYYIHHNTFRFLNLPEYTAREEPISGVLGAWAEDPFWTANNRLDFNTYYVLEPGLRHWHWRQPLTWEQLRSQGLEQNGQCFYGPDDTPCL